MNNSKMVIERLETIVAELECEFLYLINDIYNDCASEPERLQPLVENLRLARHFLGAAAERARAEIALVPAH